MCNKVSVFLDVLLYGFPAFCNLIVAVILIDIPSIFFPLLSSGVLHKGVEVRAAVFVLLFTDYSLLDIASVEEYGENLFLWKGTLGVC